MIELERINESNRLFYDKYEKAFDNNINKYQSRIFPDFRNEVVQWFHIKTGNDYIGAIWLEQKIEDDFAVLGIFIADNKLRNKGYGSQAIEKIKEICLPYMSVDKILLHVRAKNQRAVNCYIKCGFKESRRYVTSNKIEIIEMIYHHLPQRKRLRLEGYDYSQNGSYFVTLCVNGRKDLFDIEPYYVGNDPRVVPFESSIQNRIIHKWIRKTENNFDIKFDKYVIMKNHLHFIISISDNPLAERHTGRSLPEIMKWFKTMTTNEYINEVKKGNLPPFDKKLWQKSYYDHIIRDEEDYLNIWNYIDANSLKHTAD